MIYRTREERAAEPKRISLTPSRGESLREWGPGGCESIRLFYCLKFSSTLALIEGLIFRTRSGRVASKPKDGDLKLWLLISAYFL